MDLTMTVLRLVPACVLAALGIHTLATGRILVATQRQRTKLRPRPYGLGQLLTGLCLVLLPLSSLVVADRSLYYVVFFASIGCLVAGICFLVAAMIPQDRP
ncbi:hypothetical protein AB0K40_00545 [Nonomuraea bangladeshensis]|uniref:DUF3325 domain-containing protein n=1 Tax=Nonomuraea bangladeshensis TaxID=404385 RepID=A0ABV3GUV8_9ACTN